MKRAEFLKDIDNMSNHRVLLWEALKMTTGKIIEFGSGYGSTPQLGKFAQDTDRSFATYDANNEWASKMDSVFVPNNDWDSIDAADASVLFLDHAPGERREIDLAKYKDIDGIIVIHDSEPAADHGYQMRQHFDKFKYIVEVQTIGAWATMLSNSYDVTECIGTKYKDYEIVAVSN